MAARDGLILAATHGYEQVHMEMDNLTLVSLLQPDMSGLSTAAGLWQEIQELSRSFVNFKISFVHRESNEAAYGCAGFTSESNPDVFLVTLIPILPGESNRN